MYEYFKIWGQTPLVKIILIVASSIILSLVVNSAEDKDMKNKMEKKFDEDAKSMLAKLGIKEGNYQKFPVAAEKVLSIAKLESMKIDDFSCHSYFHSSDDYKSFSFKNDTGKTIFLVDIRIADYEQSARVTLGRWLALLSSMPIELLAKQYKSIANGIGEVCVVNKYFNQTFGGYTKPKLYFIRGGIIICITMFDENVNVETIARIIDQQLIKSQETEEHK